METEQSDFSFTIRFNKQILFYPLMLVVGLIALELLGRLGFVVLDTVRPQPIPTGPVECLHPNEATCPLQPFQIDQGKALGTDPFTGFAWKPDFEGRWLSTNSLGFRGPDIAVDKPDGVLRVAVVGGSAALGVGVYDDETIESNLQDILADELNQPVEVINAGVTSFQSTQELIIILTRVLPLDPDYIIVYDGRNDIYFALSPSWEPHYTPAMRQYQGRDILPEGADSEEEEAARVPFRDTPTGRWFVDNTALGRLWAKVSRVFRERFGASTSTADTSEDEKGDSPRVDKLDFHSEVEGVYESNLQMMAAMVAQTDTRLIFVTQPSLAAGDKTLTEPEESYVRFAKEDHTYYDLLKEHYPIAVDVAQRVGEQMGVPAYDFTTIFDDVEETVYLDEVHLNATGNRIVAEALADILLELMP